jgi:plasmid maintenance system antidote protein VapI
LLVDAVGAENIALGLDSNLTRVAELVNGERFTPETAFHIETTLGLPDGFFDQPNPVLTPEIIARLRSPLDFIHANVEPEATYEEVFKPAPVTKVNYHPTPTDRLLKEPEMPKKTSGGSPRAVAKNNTTAKAKPATATPPKSAPAKAKASSKSEAQQTLPLNDAAALENIRRTNLHVLTSRKGSKVRLGAVTGISNSNMDNRLYGQKRMDDAEANRFTERLGLPTGWLDVPRPVTDIPESVSDLLVPESRRHASAQQELPPPVEPKATAAKTPASTKVRTAGARHAPPPDADHTSVPTNVAAETKAVTGQQDQALSSAADLAIRQPVDNDVSFSAARLQFAPASVTQVITEPRRLTSATSLDDLLGIEPIAEALIKTLAGKARTGRLDEMKALELLQQAVLL